MRDFQRVLAEALADLASRGYVSAQQIDAWLQRLRAAMGFADNADTMARRTMGAAHDRVARRIAFYVQGADRYTLAMVAPHLRAELDRRIIASADLIKLRRHEAIAETLRRFQGWSTAIPAGGDRTVDRRKARSDIGRPLHSLPFESRRVLIDQGHKLTANVADIVATDAGAIAAIWHSNWRQHGYNYRSDHKARDERVYAVRGNWAIQKGLMTRGPNGYTDEITKPGTEIMCRCWYQYITNLRDLPDPMLTRKGQQELALARQEIAA